MSKNCFIHKSIAANTPCFFYVYIFIINFSGKNSSA